MAEVRVSYHYNDGTWWADSPDIEGMTVVAPSFEGLRSQTRDAVEFFLDGPADVVESLDPSAQNASLHRSVADPRAGS